jgi:hypothetical protein
MVHLGKLPVLLTVIALQSPTAPHCRISVCRATAFVHECAVHGCCRTSQQDCAHPQVMATQQIMTSTVGWHSISQVRHVAVTCAYLYSSLQRSDCCGVVEVLLCPRVGTEVVVARMGHSMRLRSVISKSSALQNTHTIGKHRGKTITQPRTGHWLRHPDGRLQSFFTSTKPEDDGCAAAQSETEAVCMACSDWMVHRTSPVWGANKRLIGQSNSEPKQSLAL